IYFAASYFPCNSHQLWYIIKQEGAPVLFYFFIDKGLGGNPSFTHPLQKLLNGNLRPNKLRFCDRQVLDK
ncbi:MAG: hypothetical protein ABIH71_06180, partial [Candidatus Omnitrophota bacterium]